MVLTKEELVASLQNEVRIFLHLTSKIDRAQLDYRPSAKQRSTIELLRYMSYMAPTLLVSMKAGAFDVAAFQAAAKAADAADFDALVATIGKQSEGCAELLAGYSDGDLRGEIEMFGRKGSRGWFIVNLILCACAAYRMQLFLYLKACGREELNTMNLWAGMDGSM
jgi:hypothetical protein